MNHRIVNILMSILILILIFGAGILYYFLKYKPSKELEKQNKIEEIKEEVEEKKDIVLEKIEPKNIINEEELVDNNYYANFYLENLGEFYFKQENKDLILYFLDEKIGNFNFTQKENIKIQEVIGNNNNLFIKIGSDKYLYNIITKKLKDIDIKLDIEYIKNGKDNFEFLFKTKVGIFIYSIKNSKIDYFTFFKDFIYFKNGYLGIINTDEKEKLKNLDLEDESQNLIIFYDPKTKEKNIVYKTDLELNKIYFLDNMVSFEDSLGEKYELNNIY